MDEEGVKTVFQIRQKYRDMKISKEKLKTMYPDFATTFNNTFDMICNDSYMTQFSINL